jgi:TonB family protein
LGINKLIDCKKIESSLWDYAADKLPESEAREVKEHLSKCVNCSNAFETIKAVMESKEADNAVIAGIDKAVFDDVVMSKIKTAERTNLRKEKNETRYIIRMTASMAVAAAVVLFMLLSISDLEQITVPKKLAKRQVLPEKEYDVINIDLVPVESEAPASFKDKDDELGKNIIAEESLKPSEKEEAISNVTDADTEPSKTDIPRGLETAEADFRVAAKAKKAEDLFEQKDIFSILTGPITQPSPESVNIGAVYLTDEAVPIVSQHTQASLHEVLVDSGMIESVETPMSVLITVEKMPAPLNVIAPEYPVWAKKRGFSGAVWVKAKIDTVGNVVEAFILSSNNPGLGFEEAALEAANKSVYTPAESNGLKIPVWIVFPVKFIYKSE